MKKIHKVLFITRDILQLYFGSIWYMIKAFAYGHKNAHKQYFPLTEAYRHSVHIYKHMTVKRTNKKEKQKRTA